MSPRAVVKRKCAAFHESIAGRVVAGIWVCAGRSEERPCTTLMSIKQTTAWIHKEILCIVDVAAA